MAEIINIEGLLVTNPDNDGFRKMQFGTGGSGSHIFIHANAIKGTTAPMVNSSYPQVGLLQTIAVDLDGFYKRKDGTSTKDDGAPLQIRDFINNLKEEKGSTASPTECYKNLMS